MTRERIEDYIAAATAAGPLVPDSDQRRRVPEQDRMMRVRRARSDALRASPARRAALTAWRYGRRRRLDAPQLKILSPGEDSLRQRSRRCCAPASIPADAATGVTFFVDGRQVCALTRAAVRVRVGRRRRRSPRTRSASSPRSTAGGRIVQTVRTKAVGYAEKVDVDVVQVTVTVSRRHGQLRPQRCRESAFHVFEDGQPQTITHFASEDVPLELIVADRHQRQHGAGDAEAEEGGEGISRRRARRRIR